MHFVRAIVPYVVLSLAFSQGAAAAISATERAALIAIHQSTNGASWTDDTGWLGAAGTECSWAGVRCDEAQTTVTGLFLSRNNLTGTLPADIGAFPNLTELELWENPIGGTLPTQIGNLSKLTRMLVFDTSIGGTIPPSIGNLTALVSLFLDRGQFTGPIPSTIGTLSKLETLHANGNQLNGTIPSEIGQLSKLTQIDLSYNRLGGPLPTSLGGLASLGELYLNNNEITGAIPPELAGAARLNTLRLGTNLLTGAIPTALGSMPELVVLDLFNNQLAGAIPGTLGNLPKIEFLELAQNQLSGAVPPELGQLDTLKELNAGSNQLSGSIPAALGDMASLTRLDLGSNSLSGAIPRELGRLRILVVLSLGNNQLTGEIPRELGDVTTLAALDLFSNRLSGAIPTELTQLSEMYELMLFDNQLTGTIPAGVGNLTKLGRLALGGNFLTGPIPTSIESLPDLTFLDLRGNNFSGALPDIGKLTKLEYVSFEGNSLTGTIPPSIGNLAALETLRLDHNRLTGVLPPQIGQMTKLREFLVTENSLEGELPSTLFSLTALTSLGLGANRFSGAIPSPIGQLTNLVFLDLSNNQFRGEAPASLASLTNLGEGLLDLGYNAITVSDAPLRALLDQKQSGGDVLATQTLPPTSVKVDSSDDPFSAPGDVLVTWDLPRYVGDDGGYQVTATLVDNGELRGIQTTASKELANLVMTGTGAGSLSFVVRTVTHPHGLQQNTLTSDPSQPVFLTKFFFEPPFAFVVLGAPPGILVQTAGSAVNQTTYTLVNVGTLETEVTLTQNGAFFTQSPESFLLKEGASQTITVTSIVQPAGTYEGEALVAEDGVFQGLSVPITLVSTDAVAGTVIAEPLSARVDVSAERETNPVGSVTFANRGTATLTGIAKSDVDWLLPQEGLVTIPAGESRAVGFTLDRSKRPDAFTENGAAFSASLTLEYVDAASQGLSALLAGSESGGAGVSTSLVSIVDTVKPPVTGSTIPPFAPGELGYYVPGLTHQQRSTGELLSDLSIANAFGVASVRDLRLYFTSTGADASTSVAAMGTVAPRGSVLLADTVQTVYGQGERSGSLQLRSIDANRLLTGARLVTVKSGRGVLGTQLPVFRSTRAAEAGGEIRLAGIRKGASEADLIVQETSGAQARVRIEYLNASGASVGVNDPVTIEPFGIVEYRGSVPALAVTALVTNRSDSSGRIVAYGLNLDSASGDMWIVADWSRMFGYDATGPQKIVYAPLREKPGTRRRPIRRTGASAREAEAGDQARTTLELTVHNAGETATTMALTFHENGVVQGPETISLAPRETRTIDDVAGSLFGRRAFATGWVGIEPRRGSTLSVTARVVTSGGAPSIASVPVVAASAGLRLGQAQLFAGVDDARQSTIDAKRAGTVATTLGFAESSGKPATVRVSMLYFDGRSLAATETSREFAIGANSVVLLQNIARAIVGDVRERELGDLRDIQLEIRVTAGEGSVTPFAIATDNGSGDATLRLE
ncbi:MAG: leucine-rich repeat domain-containing protein [Thermoanaerobaculia bacterium]